MLDLSPRGRRRRAPVEGFTAYRKPQIYRYGVNLTVRRLLLFLMTLSVRVLRAIFRTREQLLIENLALRQQVAALKKERPRPMLDDLDRAFWVALRAAWPGWATGLVIVDPDTVARWNRDRFRRYWAKLSRKRNYSPPSA